MKLISDMNTDDDKFEDIDDMGEEGDLLLNDDIANEENQGNHLDAYQHENQQNLNNIIDVHTVTSLHAYTKSSGKY